MSYVHDDFPSDMIAAIIMLVIMFSPLVYGLIHLR